MANLQAGEGSSLRDVSSESSGSTLQLNIKTLDSQIYSFHINKNIAVSAFKEKISSQIGIPVLQQRLIFRGKVLKDDHLMSVYNVENGDTLHVVERQPQPPPGPTTVPLFAGQDFASGGGRPRIGHISHSVVLGTLNVGEPGEAGAPDLGRVIGAVLNSVGLGNLAGGVPPGVMASQGNGTESRSNADSQNQAVPLQGGPGQSASHVGPTIAIPSLNTPIPDALTTITEFINQMELVLSQNGNQQNQPPTASISSSSSELPINSHGYPTVEALNIVLQHAQHLLRDTAASALSNTASRLVQGRGSSDLSVREQVQTESMRIGVAMQHLGVLLLELGRTILTLQLGRSPDESFVNAGPAVYISPSGPNPIMVQPFPLQNSSLFGASTGVASSPVAMGAFGVGNGPRNVNIHIHTGASLEPLMSPLGNSDSNGENLRGERANGTAASIPSRRPAVPTSSNMRPSAGASRDHASRISQIFAQMPRNRQNENFSPSAASNSSSSNVQPGPGVSRPSESDYSSIMDEIMADLRAWPSDLNVEDAPGEVSMDEIIAQLRALPSRTQDENDTPAAVSNSSNVQPSAGVSHPLDHTSLISEIHAGRTTMPRNRQNENTTADAVSNSSNAQPSPGVSRPSDDPFTDMDGFMTFMAYLRAFSSDENDTFDGVPMDEIIAQYRASPSDIHTRNDTPAEVSNSSNLNPGAGVSQPSDHTSIFREIVDVLRTAPTNRQNENTTPAAVSNSSNSQPSPDVSQPSDPTSDMDEIIAQLKELASKMDNESVSPSEGSVHQDQPVGGSKEDDLRNLSCGRIREINPSLPNVAIIDDQGKTETSTSSQGGPDNVSVISDNAEIPKVLAGSSHSNDNPAGSTGVPLGLGLGGLQAKKRSRQARTQDKISDNGSSGKEDNNSIAVGQQVLQSLASLSPSGNVNPLPEVRHNDDEPGDIVDAMSQVLHSPSLDGLFSGVSQQTGIGSPDMLRNMFQQFTQNPAMRSTLNQMAQQMEGQDLGRMFSGSGNGGQGGGIDLSGMMQQMMPIVSQALGGMSSFSQLSPPSESGSLENSRRDVPPITDDRQVVDLQPVVQRLEDQSSPDDIFRSVAARALHVSNGHNEEEGVLTELCSQPELAEEFMEMLRLDVSRRLQKETGS